MSQGKAVFAVQVVQAARTLARSGPFKHAQLAALLGAEYGRNGEREKALRLSVANLVRSGFLAGDGRRGFVAGPAFNSDEGLPPAVRRQFEVERLFRSKGGLVFSDEAQRALRVEDGADERAMTRALRAASYEYGLPVPSYRTLWWAKDQVRRSMILPGARLVVDTRLELRAAGQRWTATSVHREVERRRRRIGRGLRTARIERRLSLASVVETQLGAELARCLGDAEVKLFSGAGTESLSQWWRRLVGEDGEVKARVIAWRWLETGAGLGEPLIADTLDAAFWKAAEAELGLDAVKGSRGSVEPQQRVDKIQ